MVIIITSRAEAAQNFQGFVPQPTLFKGSQSLELHQQSG